MAGEIDVALTNHYYVLRVTEAAEGEPAVATHRFAPGDVGNLALVTGAGVLEGGTHKAAAHRFLSYLLSDAAQAEAAVSTYEYPVVGVETPDYLVPFEEATALSPDLDFERLRDIEGTLTLLRDQDLL